MNYMVVFLKSAVDQQRELDQLLVDQQNPSSPQFRKWLTPEAFGNRFGVSASDESKVVTWLNSSGFKIEHRSRANNWVAFSGSAGQVSAALHTAVHRFQVNGETHFANVSEPAVPSALADVVGGFLGLNDFHLKSFAIPVTPDLNSGTSHFLAPADFATIYNLAPLYQAGIDGTGQNIAIVGDSDIQITDIRSFRSRYGLPANDPKLVPYTTVDPGLNGDAIEADLDLEWSGAVAPNATISYVFGPSVFAALVYAIEQNVAPVVSVSFGGCEVDASPVFYRAVAQQGNAQGISILASSGDSGAAGCDRQGIFPQAEQGRRVAFPASLPEVTAVGGTQFAEGSGNYWAATNSPTFGSALSYIPEMAWNESSGSGLGASGGGASTVYPRPAWQAGPGVPMDNARHVPDISLSAAIHDGYFINYQGTNGAVGGTSASSPSMAGIIALLNQYQVANGFQNQAGLGNINPQLYRLAQSAPSVFHDTTVGDNIVPCAQGTADCLTGSFGYQAGIGYDMATGLGSVDANAFVTQWNTATQGVVVTLSSNASSGTVNDTIQLTATVAPASGGGSPTGTVSFMFGGSALGAVPLANGSASLTVPLAQLLVTGNVPISAEYSGDAAFSSGGATLRIRVTLPSAAAAIFAIGPFSVWPSPDAAGPTWQATLVLEEVGRVVPALVTGFTIDGNAQNLSQYFPSPNIQPGATISTTVIFRNLAAPLTRSFGFTGTDANGNTWSRQVSVEYAPTPVGGGGFHLAATPLIVAQNTTADPSCQWPVQLNADDTNGYGSTLLNGLFAGAVSLSSQIASIFGTERLMNWGSLQGALCFGGITPPATETILMERNDGAFQELTVSFLGPPANPGKISATPASVSLSSPSVSQPAQATLAVNLSDKTQSWTASIFPANRTTAWLSASQLSGVGSGQITLTADGTGFEPGAYRATIVLQSANAIPQVFNVPVMFVLGGSSKTSIGGVVLYGSSVASASPGTLLSFFGSNLANSTATSSGNPVPFTLAGVSATVNGLSAPVVLVSPNVVNMQVPYEAGAGPAVLGINNNGDIAGFQFQINPSSPSILADSSGNVSPVATVKQGGNTTIYVVGVGEVSPALKSGFSPSPITPVANLPKPVLPLSVTVGGVPAFVQFAGVAVGLVGTAQVNIALPASVPTGNQPVVVTVGGVSSLPVNLQVK